MQKGGGCSALLVIARLFYRLYERERGGIGIAIDQPRFHCAKDFRWRDCFLTSASSLTWRRRYFR